MEYSLAPKSLILGYKPFSFYGGRPKFATLHGEKSYRCLVLHVDPGTKDSPKGKLVQKQIQEILDFDIQKMRTFQLKNHEVYVPFEVIESKEKLQVLKSFILEQYTIFVNRNR
ncbi:hypothetical protein [Bacillus sp. FJAT-27445]|uniref:hypothetical protein n=1 Tax=Bacillus sp. FJAT-27445 TaxID=1679166 RepID=UPI000A80ADE1|nr:hypothetical protein [Bacillus sp. FJAT-27445]